MNNECGGKTEREMAVGRMNRRVDMLWKADVNGYKNQHQHHRTKHLPPHWYGIGK